MNLDILILPEFINKATQCKKTSSNIDAPPPPPPPKNLTWIEFNWVKTYFKLLKIKWLQNLL